MEEGVRQLAAMVQGHAPSLDRWTDGQEEKLGAPHKQDGVCVSVNTKGAASLWGCREGLAERWGRQQQEGCAQSHGHTWHQLQAAPPWTLFGLLNQIL